MLMAPASEETQIVFPLLLANRSKARSYYCRMKLPWEWNTAARVFRRRQSMLVGDPSSHLLTGTCTQATYIHS